MTAKLFRRKLSRTVRLKYLLYTPAGYDPKGSRRWPLMLFLHGSGERGTDIRRVAVHGPPKLAGQGRPFPFLIVAPQCPAGRSRQTEPLIALLDDVLTKHAVDRKRVFLTGISMGGFGAWNLATRYPERFAAVAPVCGGGDLLDVLLAAHEKAPALKSLPVWAFHGAKDPVVPLAESERMLNAMRRLGARHLKLTVYPEAGHNAWDKTYDNPRLYEWMLKRPRRP